MARLTAPVRPEAHRLWPGLLVWVLAAALMVALDGQAELAQLALVPVLAAAVAALWLPLWLALAAALLAVVGFNVGFVPPRGSFDVDLRAHWLLLLTLGVVSTVVTLLMDRQRRLATAERAHAQRAQDLLQLGERLRDADDPLQAAPALRELLGRLSPAHAADASHTAGEALTALLLAAPGSAGPQDGSLLGEADADERTGLWLCLSRGQAMGPGSGKHEEQPAWYLPLRGRGGHAPAGSLGAALLRQPPQPPEEAATARAHAQALCDQFGLALARARAHAAATAAAEEAQAQQLRNTLLAGISHDYRTPLATVLGAASSLQAQDERLSPAQRQRLAARIVDEVGHLTRLTNNTLQLARLGPPGPPGRTLPADWQAWESVEELAGSVVQRLRQQHPSLVLKLRVEPGLPLLRCSAELLVQLLDNLVFNALTHGRNSEGVAEVELRVHREAATAAEPELVLAVRDRGPGVPPAERERIFQAFERGTGPEAPAADAPSRRGAGVGLALCRAIAQAHGGTLRYRARAHGGASFECVLPLPPAPRWPPAPPTPDEAAP
ncbi:ATP-binding protein [Rubrivivax rivuli]|uniref:histidine kinase n=1 Tax=Rubrivivax rivuli TaxID=1862385 RepID=A0A437RCQ7_9BURK|nr:ATP-binding protein [Rubrivivax rivuli]RVU44513.1 DUF4118 domain-containing protein [Rubrivivax rivuli]